MAKYKPQYKKEDGTIADLDLCAKYDGNGNEISTTYALKGESGGGGSSSTQQTTGFFKYSATVTSSPAVGSVYSYSDSNTDYSNTGCTYRQGQMIIDPSGVIYKVIGSTMCECVYVPSSGGSGGSGGNYLPLSGGTLTGGLGFVSGYTATLGRDPAQDMEASTKSYVDTLIAALTARVEALESGGGGGGGEDTPTNLLDAYNDAYDFNGKTLTISNGYGSPMGSNWLVEFSDRFYLFFATSSSVIKWIDDSSGTYGQFYPYMSPTMTFPSRTTIAQKVYSNAYMMGDNYISDYGTESTFEDFASNVPSFTFTLS